MCAGSVTLGYRHMLLQCHALADLRDKWSPLIADCLGVMARLVWAAAHGQQGKLLHALMKSHVDDEQMLFHPFSLVGCQGSVSFLASAEAGKDTEQYTWSFCPQGMACLEHGRTGCSSEFAQRSLLAHSVQINHSLGEILLFTDMSPKYCTMLFG